MSEIEIGWGLAEDDFAVLARRCVAVAAVAVEVYLVEEGLEYSLVG